MKKSSLIVSVLAITACSLISVFLSVNNARAEFIDPTETNVSVIPAKTLSETPVSSSSVGYDTPVVIAKSNPPKCKVDTMTDELIKAPTVQEFTKKFVTTYGRRPNLLERKCWMRYFYWKKDQQNLPEGDQSLIGS